MRIPCTLVAETLVDFAAAMGGVVLENIRKHHGFSKLLRRFRDAIADSGDAVRLPHGCNLID